MSKEEGLTMRSFIGKTPNLKGKAFDKELHDFVNEVSAGEAYQEVTEQDWRAFCMLFEGGGKLTPHQIAQLASQYEKSISPYLPSRIVNGVGEVVAEHKPLITPWKGLTGLLPREQLNLITSLFFSTADSLDGTIHTLPHEAALYMKELIRATNNIMNKEHAEEQAIDNDADDDGTEYEYT